MGPMGQPLKKTTTNKYSYKDRFVRLSGELNTHEESNSNPYKRSPANRVLLVTSYNNHKMGILNGSMRKQINIKLAVS